MFIIGYKFTDFIANEPPSVAETNITEKNFQRQHQNIKQTTTTLTII